MSIKDLFGKRSNKIVTKEQADKLVDEVESHEYVSEGNKIKRKFIPKVDYSDPKNFAKYGSAEKYYQDTVEHIYGSYPYDGSDAEKSKWHRESSPLDSYIFDKNYPKAVGHVLLNSTGAASNLIIESGAGTYTQYIQPQYIYVQGGPNKDRRVSEGDEYELSKQFPVKGGKANIWDEDLYRESNLGIDPDVGNSVELWYKLGDASIVSLNKSFCLFDLWNGQAHASADYVRLLVETLPESGNDFSVTYKYGSGTEGVERAGLNLSATTKASLGINYLENWNHYAFTMKSTTAGIVLCLYVNGILEDTATVGNQITSSVPQENYVAIINAYNTKPLASSPAGITMGTGGAPQLYVDEFRFWKAERTGRDVGRNWFTSVSGGTNTDNSKYSVVDNVDIGVYYKFNEGILDTEQINPQDAVTLDYSGRISNGQIYNYSLAVRKLTSAIDESTLLDEKEVAEPIVYSAHPEVAELLSSMTEKGIVYDNKNNASFYHTMPEWILQEDEDNSYKIKELTQALSSYFDSLHLQIEALTDLRANDYQSLVGKAEKPYYFAKNLLRSVGFDVTDIFNEATILEEVASRGETELFDLKIQEVKNVIYQNIYNNITHIYKTKGTERSFRNLIRCFGIDDELIKINLYADGVDYTLEGRRGYTSIKKNYVDFNNVDRHQSIVYSDDVDVTSTDERSYILGPTADQSALLATTLTAEVIFPKQLEREHPAFKLKNFTDVSLFGTKEANVAGGVLVDHAETADNIGSFRVFAVKPDPESLNVKFKLVYTDVDGDHELVTEEYKEVYDNTKWNIAVRLRPIDADLGDHVSGASVGEYQIDFYGVNATLDTIENEFKLSASYTGADVTKVRQMIQSDKLCYVGSRRTDLTDEGTGIESSDVKVTDLMYWFDYLTDEEIKIHAIDASNHGRLYPNDDAYSFFGELSDGTANDIRVPRKDTLALYWNFQNVTSSDASGNFLVNDVSLGGSDYIAESRYGWFTELIGYRHQGKGAFKPALPNDTQVVNREYQYTARHRLPEVLSGDDMVEIRTQDDNVFVKGSKPINHFFAIEKSMSQVISTEMLSLFASIVEFNDLIGQPVNRYRMQYKSLEKFRSLFYERVENVPSFEKYVEFYKWIDSSLGLMLQQLIPASGNFSESMRNMVENHILERSKYWTKFPTLEKKQDPPEGTIRGIRELTYDWEHGHAPLSATVGVPINSKAILFDGRVSSGSPDHRIVVEDSVEKFRFTLDETPTDNSFTSAHPGFDTVNPIPDGDQPFSVSAWIKVRTFPGGGLTASDNSGVIVSKINWGGDDKKEWFFAVRPSGNLGLVLYDDGSGAGAQNRSFTQGGVVSLDTWTQVVATYGTEFTGPEVGDPINSNEFTDMKFYVNGVKITSQSHAISGETGNPVTDISNRYHAMPAWMDDSPNLIIGNVGVDNWPFDGEMADVVIYKKELSQSEVTEIYNGGSVKDMNSFTDFSSVVGWWKMGDDLDEGVFVKNYVSACHDGKLINGPAIVDVDLADLPSEVVYNNDENCLWRSERAERSDLLVTSGDTDVDADRESIRNAVVRDVLGQTKMVKVGTELVEQGKPTLYNIDTSNTYEGSTYATRRLSRPYKLNIDKRSSVTGGPNFSDSLLASPNDTIRAATTVGHYIEFDYLKSVKDAEVCNDDYGHKTQKRRAQKIKLINNAGVITELKGSLVYNSLYGSYPNDTNAEYQNFHHDSYGQDHEVPVQGPFANQWVGGNQHRHINLNVGSDNEDNRAELYKTLICENPSVIKHPYDVSGSSSPSGVYPAARYTRDGLAKRPLNIANIKSSPEQIKLGNYSYDYEVVQTSGRSSNNRWLTRNPDVTPDSIPSAYITGLYDYTLPVRGRSEHVFVERFSAPGSPSTMSRGSLDYQAGEFSPYNSMNFRNLRVRNHLNFWHKEHSMQFGYREDYIHGTPDDEVDNDGDGHMESHDFGGNTPGVASWHKNNRNAAVRMKLEGTNIHAERTYDNFFIGHQIPRSDWQYSWITSSALPFADVVLVDDENRSALSATQFPYDHDGDMDAEKNIAVHPRYSGYVTEYPNATIELAELLRSASYASHDIDFSYGNAVISEEVNYDTQTIGSSCESCRFNFSSLELQETNEDSFLNALIINKNGPYQGAGWTFLQNARNPIVRKQRRQNQISIQKRIGDGIGHEKFVEPSTTWNRPMYHLLSEEKDGVGTRVVHSYSNNLEGFANPKLTKRTGFAKRDEQFYDRLFDYYNPNNADAEQLYDFVGLSYKEYVFPKHRNVGLLKIRSRKSWDLMSRDFVANVPTGDLRIFWRDIPAFRAKNYIDSRNSLPAVNALGYKRNSVSEKYLNLAVGITEHLHYDRSIFSMDVFEFARSDDDYTKYLGDLQYTGKENYFAFILHTKEIDQIIPTLPPEAAPFWTPYDSILGPREFAVDFGLGFAAVDLAPRFTIQQEEQIVINESLYGSDYIISESGNLDKVLRPSDISIESIPNIDTPVFVTWADPQKVAPEPVVQLYYNPFNKKYEEEAWLYRSNVLAQKNPWYNKYDDFNLETRAMAQNYGLVAEFRISEHMNKYLLDSGGDFQANNYNVFSLEGANYDLLSEDSAARNGETRYSGKKRITTEKKYYLRQDYELSDNLDYPLSEVPQEKQVEELNAFQNCAFSEIDNYDKYRDLNPIYRAGTQTVKNSIPANHGIVTPTFLKEEEVSWANNKKDSTGTGRHRYFADGRPLDDVPPVEYENIVYREEATHSDWTPVVTRSNGPNSSLKFNFSNTSSDYLEGHINQVISGKHGLKFLKTMTEVGGATPSYDVNATPFTMSVWAKPKSNSNCDGIEEYDGGIKGLVTFGNYTETELRIASEQLTVYSNFPMPGEFKGDAALEEKYKNGMGLTVYVAGQFDYNLTPSDINKINLFHFFDSEGYPAVLPPAKWSHVVLQVLPQVASSPLKLKVRIDGKTMYGIHRGLLLDGTRKNFSYSVVPVTSSSDPWGTQRYGRFGHMSTSVYKLGKSRFAEESARFTYVPPIDELSEDKTSQYYFSGELMEFSLWQGVMSDKDVDRLYSPSGPRNILEDYINGEILGGYTVLSKAEKEWGDDSASKEFTNVGLSGSGLVTYTPTTISLSTEATRSKFSLLAWHRLGVLPKVDVVSVCDDWDDAFFDSYVHTDPVRFYDNIVEDHDTVTDTAIRRIRLRVNALKKLIPYRGFYPQDRTLQLAKLFADKMVSSVDGVAALHEEQSLQAALQPFFAPGILYNSIKAGVAVDWPAFTNETGLEPSNILEQCNNLPYKSEDLPGTETVVKTSSAPNWYVKRQDEYNANLALHVYDDSIQKDLANQAAADSYEQIKLQQPKYFAAEAAEYSQRGYIILSEPNTRIPFEGLVALDSVLPSKNSAESNISLTNVGDTQFKYFDIEIAGWDTEGVEIMLTQPEPVDGYGDRENYITSKTISQDNIKMVTKSIKIGDPTVSGSDEYDVQVDFRRAPVGWLIPSDDEDAGDQVTLSELNEELAVKICREINKRPDIHFVAVPGHTVWRRGDLYSPEDKVTDDHLSHLMPVAHPEIFELNFEDPPSEGTQPYDRLFEYTNLGETAYRRGSSTLIGNQGNGTWRIRIVYVGLPQLSLDMNVVGYKTTDGPNPDDIINMTVKEFGKDGYRPDVEGRDLASWSNLAHIESTNGIEGRILGVNWKETHLMCPFVYSDQPVTETTYNEAGVKTYWNSVTSGGPSGLPYSFFDGGGWIVDQETEQLLGDLCQVTIAKDVSTLHSAKWIAGYGWFGYPYYGEATALGIKFVDDLGRAISTSAFNPQQGPFELYGGIKANDSIDKIRVEPEPHKIYLMAPEYYVENAFAIGEVSKSSVSYKHPYFEYLGSNGDPRFEMAMHNFLAEVPNFFLKQGKLTSFVSKQEKEFKTMEEGKTYYMDVTMHKSRNFATAISPYSSKAHQQGSDSHATMDGRYYGPAFKWQSNEDYEKASNLDRALIGDPAQAPYVPPYLYGKSIARLYFECKQTRKYSLEEILAGVKVDNLAPEQVNKFLSAGASLKGLLSSPAWNARTTLSSSMNLFGKATAKNIEYSAQSENLFDSVNEELQKFVPLVAKDPEGSDNDVWTIGTKFECPVLNFYTKDNISQMVTNTTPGIGGIRGNKPTLDISSNAARGVGIWSGYGVIPKTDEGVFVTIEDTFKQAESFGVPKSSSSGSLIDVCGFKPEKKKIGQLAEQKEISEAVVMIPFVDNPSETTAETIKVDGRNFFKINKDLFKLQKANIENGKNAISAGEYLGVKQDIPETSISNMIRGMKKYNLPPRYDFVRYPLKKSQEPFVMYIFEFHHILNKQDLSDIWQGLPPSIANTAAHDSVEILHDLSPVDFFEENNLPKNVRWMVFKVKKKANENYFETTSDSTDDDRFEFNFEFGKMPPKYNYNWPYDFFTMLEMVQVEAGLDIMENKLVALPQVKSTQGEVSTSSLASQLAEIKIKSGDND